jgi:hypothetical protein
MEYVGFGGISNSHGWFQNLHVYRLGNDSSGCDASMIDYLQETLESKKETQPPLQFPAILLAAAGWISSYAMKALLR